MSRYIDADNYKKDLIQLGFLPALVVSVLDKQPTADVVEVVRCKDCKHWATGYGYCRKMGVNSYGDSPVGRNDYCSYGERKEQNEG